LNGNLLLFNLATDADDPVLGFTTHWINRLASYFAAVDVITMRAGRIAVADNVRVYSVGKERGLSEVRRAAEFYRILGVLLATRRYAACFAHMMPLFAAMSAPLLKMRGIPLTLWYTHRQNSRVLEQAARLSDRIVTAASDSFPIANPKLRVLGHGIDVAFFDPDNAVLSDPPPMHGPTLTRTQVMLVASGGYIVQVARLMPIKHQHVLIHAVAKVYGARAVLVGGTPQGQDGSYEHMLRGLAHGLDLGGRIVFVGPQTPEIVREHYRRSVLAVNLSPPGLFDKAALESMAMATPTLVSSRAFDPLLGEYRDLLRIESPDDVDGLAERIDSLLSQDPAYRKQIGRILRQRVIESHGLESLIARLVNVLRTGEP
jgi:glycosyltransferase involved in cell wall biosynthesis